MTVLGLHHQRDLTKRIPANVTPTAKHNTVNNAHTSPKNSLDFSSCDSATSVSFSNNCQCTSIWIFDSYLAQQIPQADDKRRKTHNDAKQKQAVRQVTQAGSIREQFFSDVTIGFFMARLCNGHFSKLHLQTVLQTPTHTRTVTDHWNAVKVVASATQPGGEPSINQRTSWVFTPGA
jgi:hypothetical protein